MIESAVLEYAGLLILAVLLFWAWYYDLPEPEKVPGPSLVDVLWALLILATCLGLAALLR